VLLNTSFNANPEKIKLDLLKHPNKRPGELIFILVMMKTISGDKNT